jgi:23S rRNA U2552 (ribose-2'-O)-methylase RlmE/FtsJ
LDIKPIDGVDFLRGDFTEIEVYEALLALTKSKKVDSELRCSINTWSVLLMSS